MLQTIAVEGYRSLRSLVVPLGRLTVVTGANGTGRSAERQSSGRTPVALIPRSPRARENSTRWPSTSSR